MCARQLAWWGMWSVLLDFVVSDEVVLIDPLGCVNYVHTTFGKFSLLTPTHNLFFPFYFSISIWQRHFTGGHRQTRIMSSLFFLMPRYHTLRFIHYEFIIYAVSVMHLICDIYSLFCAPGSSSEHSDLCTASQAGGEDSSSTYWERQYQHWRECGVALSSK